MNDEMIVELTIEEQHWLAGLLTDVADDALQVKFWVDPLDRALKVKVSNGTWSPPMGRVVQ